MRLRGCDSREAVERLHGTVLRVALADAPALDEGEYWAHELEGCAVTDGERAVGTVSEMRELPSVEVLAVAREDGEELLVPMVGDAVRSIDVAGAADRHRPGVPRCGLTSSRCSRTGSTGSAPSAT